MIDFGYGIALGHMRRENIWNYFYWRNDPAIWKWCRQYDLLSEENHENWFKSLASKTSIKMYEIRAHRTDKDQECIGVCGLTDIDMINRRAEFSLYIAPASSGNKYGDRALKTLLHHGFRNLGLETIWGETFETNPAQKGFASIGMKNEGTRRNFYFRDGKFINAYLFSMLRHEFEACTWRSLRG